MFERKTDSLVITFNHTKAYVKIKNPNEIVYEYDVWVDMDTYKLDPDGVSKTRLSARGYFEFDDDLNPKWFHPDLEWFYGDIQTEYKLLRNYNTDYLEKRVDDSHIVYHLKRSDFIRKYVLFNYVNLVYDDFLNLNNRGDFMYITDDNKIYLRTGKDRKYNEKTLKTFFRREKIKKIKQRL